MSFNKKKFSNTLTLIDLMRKKKIKMIKSLNPIYVYNHYGKKN